MNYIVISDVVTDFLHVFKIFPLKIRCGWVVIISRVSPDETIYLVSSSNDGLVTRSVRLIRLEHQKRELLVNS